MNRDRLVRELPTLSFKLLLTIILSVFVSMSAFAQETTGSVEGTTTDSSGAKIPGATVKIEGAAFTRTVVTDKNGFYQVIQVPAGTYRIVASAQNFSSAIAQNVIVTLGRTTPLNFDMKVGQVSEQVVVTASDSVGIDVTSNKLQTNLSTETLDRLPKGTNFASSLQYAPNVRPEPMGAGFQIDGASGAENTFIIDGQEVTNFRTGQLNTNNNIPFGFVQEVQVKSNGFEAEYGGATGGVINVVTQRGKNGYHGNAGIQFETDSLSAAKINAGNQTGGGVSNAAAFNLRPTVLGPSNSVLSYVQARGDSFTNYFPTGSIGGHIIKDKLWFLGNYEPQFFKTERTINYISGAIVGPQTYVSKTRRDYGRIRLDGQLSEKINLFSNYIYNPVKVNGLLGDITSSAPFSNAQGIGGAAMLSQQGGRAPSTIINFGGTYTPNAWLVLNSRFGRSYLNEKLAGYGVPNEVRSNCVTNGNAHYGATGSATCAPGFNSIPNNFQIEKDISIRKTWDLDASIIANNFAGRHQFKLGYQLNDVTNDVNNGYFDTGWVQLRYSRPKGTNGPTDLRGDTQEFDGIGNRDTNEDGIPDEIGYGFIQRFSTAGKAASKNQALFFQDSWQPFSRLTLNLGLRLENENVPSFAENAASIKFGWGDKLSPRIGGAFDVLGNGKIKLFASYGRFFDRFKYELPRGSFGGDKFLRNYFPILRSDSNWQTYTRSYALAKSERELDFRVPSNDPSDNRIDPDLDAARQSEFTVGTEFELTRNMVVSSRFTHKQVDRAIEDVGIFDAGGSELYFIANPGYGVVSSPLLPGVPATPKAERKYDALELRLDKRFARSFRFTGSYTYSRLFGNYSGLASSDERGRSSPNVNRFFDLPFLGFTMDGVADNGRLATDRPHVFKFDGSYALSWNRFGLNNHSTEFSTFFIAQSGSPLSSRVTFYSADTFLFGRGDLGRTEKFTQTDFYVKHKIKMGSSEQYELDFGLNVINLFNQNAALDLFTNYAPTNITATTFPGLVPLGTEVGDEGAAIQRVFNGGFSSAITSGLATDARYKAGQTFQAPRELRFGIGFRF